jgi:hypothetical protein
MVNPWHTLAQMPRLGLPTPRLSRRPGPRTDRRSVLSADNPRSDVSLLSPIHGHGGSAFFASTEFLQSPVCRSVSRSAKRPKQKGPRKGPDPLT